MRLHYLQHVPFEDIGIIDAWARKNRHRVTGTRFFEESVLPGIESVDVLVVMGGPMNVYEEKRYPWLTAEKRYIEQAIKQNKSVLGICLGAQLISTVLGSRVYKNTYKEIGWFPVSKTPQAAMAPAVSAIPDEFTAFHWHGDTFDLPKGAVLFASSQAYANQGFIYQKKVVGLQFHLEITREGVQKLLSHCGDDLNGGPYIQSEEAIIQGAAHSKEINRVMGSLLDGFIKSSE